MHDVVVSEVKLEYSKYLQEVYLAFKSSPLVYSHIDTIVYQLELLKHKVEEYVAERNLDKAVNFSRALLDKSLEELSFIDDSEGKIAEFTFHLFDVYAGLVSQVQIDAGSFFEDVIDLYLKEDIGFSDELIYLMMRYSALPKDRNLLESMLRKSFQSTQSKYLKDKLVRALLHVYQYDDVVRFVQVCSLYSNNSWEGWIAVAEKYAQTDQLDKAYKTLQTAARENPLYDYIFLGKLKSLEMKYSYSFT